MLWIRKRTVHIVSTAQGWWRAMRMSEADFARLAKGKQVKPLMYVLAVLFVLKYIFL